MKRSKFNLGHYKLLTCQMGQLVPVTWFETLPGDTIEQATSALVRCAPLVSPVMHPIQVRFHHFFVPNRIIWTNWPQFITGGSTGSDTTQHPYVHFSSVTPGSLADYLGCPQSTTADNSFNALPFRAYALIFNEYYRDEDLVTAAGLSTGDGVDGTTSLTLQNIAWEKDYLTSARPWAFKGNTVTLPLGSTAPIQASGPFQFDENTANPTGVQRSSTVSGSAIQVATTGSGSGTPLYYHAGLVANLASATAIDINTVRHAFALQRFQEARARYGSRYTEYLRYLGVRSSDARLQRPEYLGGSKQIIQFSEVLQTAPTTAGTAGGAGGVGQFGGHGITAVRGNFYRRFFEEHGIVMTLMSVRPRTMYSNRTKRAWLRGNTYSYGGLLGTREDYWQRELQHIGQQGIASYEVDPTATPAVFGYQDRYDEYRREESSVAGQFGSAGTLHTWHLSREFGSAPSLNSTFVSCVPSTRIFADTAHDNLYVMARHQIRARRLVAREGTSSVY